MFCVASRAEIVLFRIDSEVSTAESRPYYLGGHGLNFDTSHTRRSCSETGKTRSADMA